ncbi:MAG: calcium-binding protein [Gammaproteobacteria bacterium]|nr:calcium-binding protein [Gammaproteobacteria bacterium]|tara:strand:- start:107 stop:991 length:885 start_codon:yes stop_codon:yes gene_type:complete
MAKMEIKVLFDLKNSLGEGPQWDVKNQRLYWIDSFDKKIYRSTADGGELKYWELPEIVGSFCLTKKGNALLAGQSGLLEFDFDDAYSKHIFAPKNMKERLRFNDGKVDRNGNFFFGAMDVQEKKEIGAIYRCDEERHIKELDTGFVVFNGPCWSPDGTTFYASDSGAGKIWRYDHNPLTGMIKKKTLIKSTTTPLSGSFDGCTIDVEGCLWSARIFGGKIDRISPDGSLIQSIKMPIMNPTSVAFGGSNLDILYVTSMGKIFSTNHPKDNNYSGALFAITGLGIRGIEEKRHNS